MRNYETKHGKTKIYQEKTNWGIANHRNQKYFLIYHKNQNKQTNQIYSENQNKAFGPKWTNFIMKPKWDITNQNEVKMR